MAAGELAAPRRLRRPYRAIGAALAAWLGSEPPIVTRRLGGGELGNAPCPTCKRPWSFVGVQWTFDPIKGAGTLTWPPAHQRSFTGGVALVLAILVEAGPQGASRSVLQEAFRLDRRASTVGNIKTHITLARGELSGEVFDPPRPPAPLQIGRVDNGGNVERWRLVEV